MFSRRMTIAVVGHLTQWDPGCGHRRHQEARQARLCPSYAGHSGRASVSSHRQGDHQTYVLRICQNDILQVSQSITDGLKALRGDGDSKDKDRASGRSSDRDRPRDRERENRVPQTDTGSGYGTWSLVFSFGN